MAVSIKQSGMTPFKGVPSQPSGGASPMDPCQRLLRFGPIQPMPQARSLLHRLLFG